MASLWSLLTLVHLIGLSLSIGAASVKLSLLLKCQSDPSFASTYTKVVKTITRFIVIGIGLLTLSGIGWIILGFPFSGLLVAKIVVVVLVWILGPTIDNAIEPKFLKLASAPDTLSSPEFAAVSKRYLTAEIVATALLFAALLLGWLL
jgi:hypothetical protein